RGGFYDALVDQTWLWDGSDWSELEPVTRPSPRSRLSLTWDSNRHRAVLFGGEIGQSTPDAETWEFDGSAWIQFSPGTHPPAQTGAAFAYDAFNQECVLFGNDETWTWDGSVWTQHTPGMHPLGDACMAFDPVNQETVLLTDATLETWTWDGAAWTQLFPSNPPFAALFIDSDMVYDAVRNECVTLIWDDMDVHTYTWDGTDWSHVVTGGPVFNGAMAFDPGSGHVLYFGGTGAAIGYEADALWVWNGSEWSSSRVYESGGPHAKSLAGMTPINDGVMMFGGIMQYTYRDAETWIFRNTPDVPALDFIGIAVLLIGIGGILIIRRTPML
ncbi:MAG TPA: hypothetical protein PLV45_12000, partial [bacterium]|nr:hypothetical protein [bacterium]